MVLGYIRVYCMLQRWKELNDRLMEVQGCMEKKSHKNRKETRKKKLCCGMEGCDYLPSIEDSYNQGTQNDDYVLSVIFTLKWKKSESGNNQKSLKLLHFHFLGIPF
jgi:hypothetical protein